MRARVFVVFFNRLGPQSRFAFQRSVDSSGHRRSPRFVFGPEAATLHELGYLFLQKGDWEARWCNLLWVLSAECTDAIS